MTLTDAVLRADDITTKREAAHVFIRQPSGRALVAAVTVLLLVRTLIGQWSVGDAAVVLAILVLAGPFEWIVHRSLLHAPADSARRNVLGTGRGHVLHHEDPPLLRWLMLCWQEALLFAAGLGVVSAVVAVPTALVLDEAVLPTAATAWTVATLGLVHYEWTHLLVHTRYRCRSRYYRDLERHHRLHHYRNEHYWLGVTLRSGDRLFQTMPERGRVDVSPTARSLDQP